MKKLLFVILSFIALLIINCFFPKKLSQPPPPEEQPPKMSLEEKVGQMLILGFSGEKSSPHLQNMISEKGLGGVILMNQNIANKNQLKDLISSLQSISAATSSKTPLFIAVDQEGGTTTRLRVEGISEFTPQWKILSEDRAYQVAKNRAVELKSLGINLNLSPVLDFSTQKKAFLYPRAFRGTIEEFKKFGVKMVLGYTDGGIISIPKHFPGHGNQSSDPHKGKVIISEQEYLDGLAIFKEIVRSANPEIVMVGHITVPHKDQSPASLSKILLTDVLKKELGYQGLIMSDDLNMGAVWSKDPTEAAVKAINAGVNLLLFLDKPERQVQLYEGIVSAVREGRIEERRIDESVLKILKLKKEIFRGDSN